MNVNSWFSSHSTMLSSLVAIGAFLWPVYQFVIIRRSESRQREFENYHRLVKLVSGEQENGPIKLDRQAAAIFELRHFQRYREFTIRMLPALKEYWTKSDSENLGSHRLFEEIESTLAALRK